MGKMRGTVRTKDSVLSFSASGEAGRDRLGAGKLSLWRERRRRDREAEIRSLLHPALLVEARRDDRAQDRAHGFVREGTLSAVRSARWWLVVIGYWCDAVCIW